METIFGNCPVISQTIQSTFIIFAVITFNTEVKVPILSFEKFDYNIIVNNLKLSDVCHLFTLPWYSYNAYLYYNTPRILNAYYKHSYALYIY